MLGEVKGFFIFSGSIREVVEVFLSSLFAFVPASSFPLPATDRQDPSILFLLSCELFASLLVPQA